MPEPLHPVVVHLPLALLLLVPLFALGALLAIKRGVRPSRAWGLVVALQVLLAATSWAATQTGEQDEHRVEEIVGEEAIEEHEEAGKLLMIAAGVVALLSSLGMAGGRIGGWARVAGTAGALVVLFLGYRAGASGGALVYEHGAAGAYVTRK